MIDPPVDSDDGRLIFDAGVLAMNYSADYLLRAARNPDEGVSGAGSALPNLRKVHMRGQPAFTPLLECSVGAVGSEGKKPSRQPAGRRRYGYFFPRKRMREVKARPWQAAKVGAGWLASMMLS